MLIIQTSVGDCCLCSYKGTKLRICWPTETNYRFSHLAFLVLFVQMVSL